MQAEGDSGGKEVRYSPSPPPKAKIQKRGWERQDNPCVAQPGAMSVSGQTDRLTIPPGYVARLNGHDHLMTSYTIPAFEATE